MEKSKGKQNFFLRTQIWLARTFYFNVSYVHILMTCTIEKATYAGIRRNKFNNKTYLLQTAMHVDAIIKNVYLQVKSFHTFYKHCCAVLLGLNQLSSVSAQ